MLRKSRLPILLAAATILAAGNLACKKTGSEPTGYGVNVTIDATMLSSAERASITSVTFTVVDDTQPTLAPFKHTLDGDIKQLQGGKVTFQYVPNATVVNTDTLELGVDALAGAALVASGASGKVPLKATAVEALITLAGLGDGGVTPGDGGDGGAGKKNGIACVTGDECNSTFCSDGVCCNEKCNDVCVSCNQAATKGVCTPYAVNTDPEMECAAVIPTAPPTDDGGTTTAEAGTEGGSSPEAGGGSSDASAASAEASTDADNSAAVTINEPDGGFMTMPNACAGTCGGARACKYPGATTTCGTPFCNSRRDVGTFVCDGNGGCAPSLSSCTDYACDNTKGACGTTCQVTSACLAEDYCDGTEKCLGKKGDGIACANADECTSGNCSGAAGAAVCCNTACDGAGLTCTQAGHVGQCQCMGVTCAAGVACQVFYRDADGDGYGNASGTIAAGTAAAGCMGMTPPTGFVADNTDCDDGDANAHPGQTAFFATASKGIGTFDYNCDNASEKETPEYPGGSCKYCGAVGSCSSTTATCTAANESGSFQCPQEGIYRVPVGPIEPIEATTTAAKTIPTTSPLITMTAMDGTPGLASRATIAPEPILRACCGCAASDKTGFLATVACGNPANTYTCTSCSGVGGGTSAGLATIGTIQRCH
ncbi:MAG TPA: hypothetical protein VLA14_09800 [Polyangia bacterium]|jgi:hypothetical protein|nr:hypothetical protein [Polyangia bacterium]